jgi:hypothetical protein
MLWASALMELIGAHFRHNPMKRTGIKATIKTQGIDSPSSPRLLTIKRAAEWLGLTAWALRERIWAGQIPVVQFPGGRKQYIDTKDLEEFIKKNKRVIV